MTLRPDTSKLNLSFSGCAFLGVYHIGVCSAIRDHARWLYEGKPVAGSSAGAIVAAGLITEVPLEAGLSLVALIASKAREHFLGAFNPSFNIVRYLRQGLNVILPDNAHEICTNRLHISLTRVWDRKNVLISEYRSKEDLIQALICSSFVPFYCGMVPPEFRGERYMDGSISDNLPILNSDTITVAPFAGETDICPDDQNDDELLHVTVVNTSLQCSMLNLHRLSRALFPPGPEAIERICRRGFDDAVRYLYRHRLISCESHTDPVPYADAQVLHRLSSEQRPRNFTCTSEGEEAEAEAVAEFHLADDDHDDAEAVLKASLAICTAVERRRLNDTSFFDSNWFAEWRCKAEKEQVGMNPRCKQCRSRVQLALSDQIPQSLSDVFRSKTLEETLRMQTLRSPSFSQLLTMPYAVPIEYSLAISKYVFSKMFGVGSLQISGNQVVQVALQLIEYLKKQSSLSIRCRFSVSEFLQPLSSTDSPMRHPHRPLGPAFSSPALSNTASQSSNVNVIPAYRNTSRTRRMEIAMDFQAQAHSHSDPDSQPSITDESFN